LGSRLYDAFARKSLQRTADQRARHREAFGEPGFDKMVPEVELLFENVGDDLTGQEILAARFLALTHLQPLPARSRAAIIREGNEDSSALDYLTSRRYWTFCPQKSKLAAGPDDPAASDVAASRSWRAVPTPPE
jgi:hypothetical protein